MSFPVFPDGGGSRRPVLGPDEVLRLTAEFRRQLERRIERKGCEGLISRREILGVVTEEYVELAEAVHLGHKDRIRSECWDVAIAGAVGVASLDGGVEW